jgi:hypothetical protein
MDHAEAPIVAEDRQESETTLTLQKGLLHAVLRMEAEW